MRKFDVTGMSCAACSARVEKAVSSLEGVDSCSVNLLTNSMTVEGGATNKEIIDAVMDAGYGARLQGEGSVAPVEDAKKETRRLISRLISSCAVLLVLMYISMGHLMWSFPLPEFLSRNPLAMAITQMILAAVVMLINKRFFVNGAKGVIHGAPNMDTLVSLGSGAAFVYSVCMIYKMTATANMEELHHILHGEMYFESAAMIVTLITVGKMLEARAKGKTTSAIESLVKLTPKLAHKINDDGSVEDVPCADIKVGDRFCVYAGESIPTDADIVEGACSIDESMLTGESMPVDKTVGNEVFGGTVSRAGYIVCRAKNVGESTVLSGIIKMVSDATATKAPIAKIADRVSGIFVPCVLGISLVTAIVWLIVSGMDVGYSLARGISVLVISCPCALGLATPVAIMVGSGVGAKRGILFKDAASLENIGKANIILLDKTGTITEGKPRVTDVYVPDASDERELLSVAYALESRSEHPLAHAVVEYATGMDIEKCDVADFTTVSGHGVSGRINGADAYGGSISFVAGKAPIDKRAKEFAETLASSGKTPVAFAVGDKLLGVMGIADSIRENSREEISRLKAMGLYTVMLTGDNKKTARAIADECGVDYVISDVTPDKKGEVAREMKQFGRVIMVGDGINDAVALTVADIGVAIGAGSHIALDAASAVLIGSGIENISRAIRLGRKTLLNIKENLFWAFAYNVIGIPIAAGALVGLTGITMSPMIGALAMSLSSFCVVTNALRLNLVKLDINNTVKIKSSVDIEAINEYFKKKEEEKRMEITIKVGGMMCPHCEARVKKCLEANGSIISAETSHVGGFAKVVTDGNITVEEIKSIIVDAGYEVLD